MPIYKVTAVEITTSIGHFYVKADDLDLLEDDPENIDKLTALTAYIRNWQEGESDVEIDDIRLGTKQEQGLTIKDEDYIFTREEPVKEYPVDIRQLSLAWSRGLTDDSDK